MNEAYIGKLQHRHQRLRPLRPLASCHGGFRGPARAASRDSAGLHCNYTIFNIAQLHCNYTIFHIAQRSGWSCDSVVTVERAATDLLLSLGEAADAVTYNSLLSASWLARAGV